MIYTENLARNILLNPLQEDVNQLYIVSGYATPNMTSWFMKNIPEGINKDIELQLIVGMVPFDGLTTIVHEGFKELVNSTMPKHINKFQCSYVYDNSPVHTKLYIWLKDNEPKLAFTGSANFTQMAYSKSRREMMTECNPDNAYQYYNKLLKDTIYCNHGEVEEHIILHPTHAILDIESKPKETLSGLGIKSVTLSLLTRTGDTGNRSGLNWGHRGSRNRNEAYIALPSNIARTDFFPLNKRHFTVVTDDGKQLILRTEQENNKAITTPLNNSLLGEYFRNRLGLQNGAYISREDLLKYGRSDVTFYRIDDEQYYMDFSVNKSQPEL